MVAHKKHGMGNHERASGILFTTSTPSKIQQSANTLLGILDALFDRDAEVQFNAPNATASSVSDAISEELSQLSRVSKRFWFGGELSRGIGLIGVQRGSVPSDVVHQVLLGKLPGQPPMFLSRIIPIDFVSAPNIQSFSNTLLPVIKSHFESLSLDHTWKLVLDKHGLTNISKEGLLQLLQEVIPERHEVSIHEPEIVVMVQITQRMCGVSFLKDYDLLCEYNIRKLILQRNSTSDSSIAC